MADLFPAIADYAIIGNGRTAALISRAASIDWCCWPRFDSPAQFCRLLDVERGGFFQVAPPAWRSVTRSYEDATNLLATTFTTESGVLRLTDLMPLPDPEAEAPVFPHRLLRRVECVDGEVDVRLVFRPTFDYARRNADFHIRKGSLVATADDEALSLASEHPLQIGGDRVSGAWSMRAGQRSWLVLNHSPVSECEQHLQHSEEDSEAEYRRTREHWRSWIGNCSYDGRWRDLVIRSALVLKLLVYQPGGGLIAAPTTSLPSEIGGVRNWDYRYTWLRDSGLVLDALQQLGYHDESMQFIDWLEQLKLSGDGLRVMYTADGTPAPAEEELSHLSGYRRSRPVRIGNAAVDQMQIDNYGHVIDAVVLCYERMPRPMNPKLWSFLRKLVNRTADRWREPDQGPWEMRGSPRHYLYSKLYCWVGFDRAIRFAEQHDLPGELQHWKEQRAAVRSAILEHGFDADLGAFTQAFDSSDLDASVLPIPLSGFLRANDPRMQSTVEIIRERLARDGLVYRYSINDGLPGRDATFTLCSFWLVMNLALQRKIDEATDLFERICGHANDVGLLSEQIEPASGLLLGNFPQGFTHLGLVRAALHLAEE